MATHLTLNSGHKIPTIGLGVYKSEAGAQTYDAVLSALKLGYRHIDTAQVYGNEADVGRAVRDSGIPREEIFVTSKLWRDAYGYDRGLAAVTDSVSRTGLPYIDLMLLHSPGSDPLARVEAWQALEEAVRQGLVRSIGVSNFSVAHLDKLATTAKITPAVNQIEVHPFLQRRELVQACQDRGIVVEAYSPLAKASRLADPRVGAVAQRLGKTPAQVLLRWCLERGMVALPKSVDPQRQAANLDVYGFTLDEQAVRQLDELEEGLVTGWDPVASDPV